MPAPLRIKLNESEDATLKSLSYADNVPRRTKARATALRMNAQGWNVPDIAEHLGWSQQSVRQAIERWNNIGLMGLWDAPRTGRKRRWADEDWQVIEQAVGEPRRYSARQLSQKLLETRQVQLGQEQVRRILKKKATNGDA
ncbi:helix-turn-helix domain-containing protein [Phormidium tenue FACHB-886]|nr:helix-turn-helix domain-containing protein [Phormidium tenue FACHB-886]